jgi:ubiquinone/menaquinone biosynthesis C-methylase UbiE
MMERPYQALASRYDAVMEHVDHAAWAVLVERIWRLHGAKPTRILETGAGTCRLAPHLQRGKRSIVASDLSPEMLAEGKGRIEDRVAADFRRLPFRDGCFDAVLCLYDAVNYCLTLPDLRAFFSEASRVLAGGGALLADVTTATNSRRNFMDATSHEELDGVHVVRHSWYEPVSRLQHNDFHFFEPDGSGLYRLRQEEHSQRIWALTEFDQASARAGFTRVGAWDDNLEAASARSERIHLVFRKDEA